VNLFELARTVPITSIIEHFGLSTHNQAGQTVMPCPFHEEKTGSFTIHRSKNYFNCFGCGAAGDGTKFVEKYCNLQPKDAAIYVCKLGGIQIDERPNQATVRQIEDRQEQHKLEQALTNWANDTCIKLCALRRGYFWALDEPENYDSTHCTNFEYTDYILDLLQYGSLKDKLNVNRAVRQGEAGLAGAWVNVR
jgi:hypothetical protein